MIINTLMRGLVAAIVCVFLLSVAWEAAHEQHGDKNNLVAVVLAMLGAVAGLMALTWAIEGL